MLMRFLPALLCVTAVAFAQSSVPTITGATPSTVDAGGPAFTITVNMSSFIAGAKVKWSGTELERRFRSFNPPVIVRVEEGRVILDFRTISRQKRTNCCGLFNTCCKPNGKDLHTHERLSGLF